MSQTPLISLFTNPLASRGGTRKGDGVRVKDSAHHCLHLLWHTTTHRLNLKLQKCEQIVNEIVNKLLTKGLLMSKNVILGISHVIYPESCPINNVIEHILPYYPVAISPIHNRDLDSKGNLKKPHYHLLFQGKLSEKDKRYISNITTMKYFEPAFDMSASYFYLYHWNTKTNWFFDGKAQYWSADIIKSETFSFIPSLDLDVTDYFLLMVDYLRSFTEFSDFINFLAYQNDEEFRKYCLNHIPLINNYINSNRSKKLAAKNEN